MPRLAGPAEDVEVEHGAEDHGQHGAVVLQLHVAQRVHREQVEAMGQEGTDHEAFGHELPAILHPGPTRQGGDGGAQI